MDDKPYIAPTASELYGTEGFGANTVGGAGGKVYHVTTLADSGAGSLREALEATGTRVIRFKVSGNIEIDDTDYLKIENPNVTIDGSSAPDQGVCIKGNMLSIEASEVIVRYLRVRPGPDSVTQTTSVLLYNETNPIRNIVISHVSASWGRKEDFLMYGLVSNVTVDWSLFCESLHDAIPQGGSREFNTGPDTDYLTIHHSLIGIAEDRVPKLESQIDHVEFVNNVCLPETTTPFAIERKHLDLIGNTTVHLTGVGAEIADWRLLSSDAENVAGSEVYETDTAGIGDYGTRSGVITENEGYEYPRADAALFGLVTAESASNAYTAVLADVGCNLPARDTSDTRVIALVSSRDWALVSDPDDVGGWPDLTV